MRYSEAYYRASLDEDAKRFRVAPMDPAAMAQPLAWASELSAPRTMKVQRDALETPHLKITTRVIKEWAATASGQRFRFEHIVLSITNRTARSLAYLVDTAVSHPETCRSQGAISHNAIALKPGETVARTECLFHKGQILRIKRVEVLELPQLSYYYLSRLNAIQVQLDPRTGAGHAIPPPAKECNFVPWRDIQASAEQAHTGWADVMDFYARHNCDEYSYWRGYRRWTAPGRLPSRPPEGGAEAERVDHPAASK
jgi:hypothetical protein